MRNLIALVSALQVAGAASTPLVIEPRAQQQSGDACTTLSQFIQSHAVEGKGRLVEDQLVHDCLTALSFKSQLTGRFLTELRKYVQFQSTLEALKAPPKSYLSPTTDILGGLDTIAKTTYQSQYDFDMALTSLFNSANDAPIYSFAPEVILIIGDGMCASTCTAFVNLMTNVGGVRTVAFGGRPGTGPMQIMGGVRGSQVYPVEAVYDFVTQADTRLHEKPSLLSKDLTAKWQASRPINSTAFPLLLRSGGVNFRNAYQQGDDATPLQFAYQAADGRLFYMFDNYAYAYGGLVAAMLVLAITWSL
ncbi:peptidase S41 family protein [Apiospora aurea]|uniref:Peptidase S41 family protein n=1 Tax=Apiospora aurea TaxID=335848 RepID=A0ABR1QK04_9PEZI